MRLYTAKPVTVEALQLIPENMSTLSDILLKRVWPGLREIEASNSYEGGYVFLVSISNRDDVNQLVAYFGDYLVRDGDQVTIVDQKMFESHYQPLLNINHNEN